MCPTNDHPVRVVVVDDHDMVATAMEASLDRDPRIDVVGVATTPEGALRAAGEHRPDVMVVDVQLGATRTPPSFGRWRKAAGECAILVLTGSASERAMLESFDCGAVGFLSKKQTLDVLVDGVVRAARGEVVVAPHLVSRLAARSVGRGRDRSLLSRRELEILDLLAHGTPTESIAESLHLSVHTVRNHVARLSMRLGAHSRLEAVTEAIRLGVISPPAVDDP